MQRTFPFINLLRRRIKISEKKMFLTTELKVTWGMFSIVEASWRKLIV